MTPALAALVSQAIAVYGDGHDHPSFRVATLVTTHGVRHGSAYFEGIVWLAV